MRNNVREKQTADMKAVGEKWERNKATRLKFNISTVSVKWSDLVQGWKLATLRPWSFLGDGLTALCQVVNKESRARAQVSPTVENTTFTWTVSSEVGLGTRSRYVYIRHFHIYGRPKFSVKLFTAMHFIKLYNVAMLTILIMINFFVCGSYFMAKTSI